MPNDPDHTPSPRPEDARGDPRRAHGARDPRAPHGADNPHGHHTAPRSPQANAPARNDPAKTDLARTGPPPLSWPRALAHGLTSAFVLVLLLTLFMGLLGEVPFALLFFAGLVLPPALSAHHYARRPLPAPRPRDTRTAPEVLDYARAIQSLDYQPGPGSTEDDLADYQLALDVYDKSRTADSEDLDHVLAEGWSALTRLRTPNAEWNHGEGDAVLRLPRPEPGTMAVLALTSPALGLVRVRTRSGRGPWARLYEAGGPVCALLPLAAREEDSVRLELRLEGAWRLAVLGAHVIRRLTPAAPRLSGYGGDVLALENPEAERLSFRHTGPGPYQLRRLTPTLRPAEVVAEGMGEARLSLASPTGFLQIQTRGGWTLDGGESTTP
ncbi:cell wall protein [Streptomyces sp. NPDC004959]|uniref:cell wall protein n=1 Tax=Streptomyces sp. NPDC004959 TaxID=3154673 RepID=UPI0033A8198B